jgi:hypothetical protein
VGLQLRLEYIPLVNFRRFHKQFCSLGHQRGGDFPAEVSFAAGFVTKNIKNPKAGISHANGEPGNRAGFLLDEGQGAFQKVFDFGLLSWFCLQLRNERKLYFCHDALPSFCFSIRRFVLDAEEVVWIPKRLKQ